MFWVHYSDKGVDAANVAYLCQQAGKLDKCIHESHRRLAAVRQAADFSNS